MSSLRKSDFNSEWEDRSQVELVDFIIEHYHRNAIFDLKLIIDLASKVESAHRGDKLCPKGLSIYLSNFEIDFQEHLLKEEEVLFPILKNGQGRLSHMPIRVMQEEHMDHSKVLLKIRDLTFNFTHPDSACRTWESLYEKLRKFEKDMNEHIYLEDYILFTRALLP